VRVLFASFFLSRSLLSERATGVFIILASIFLILSLSLSDINIAVKYRLLEDALLASEGFIMLLSALFYPFLLMEKERKNGIFVFVLSGGCSRAEYLLSQFAALFTLISTLFALFLCMDLLFLSLFADGVSTIFATKLFYSYLLASLLSFLTLSLARFVSNANALIYAVFLYFIGSGADELWLYAKSGGIALQSVANLIYYLFPNFSFFDPLSRATQHLDSIFVVLYFILYSTLLFLVSLFRFKNEALKVG